MRRSFAYASCLATLLPACGLGEVHDAHTHKPRAVQTWDVGEGLAAHKRVVVEACKKEGASDERIALVLAIGLGESSSFDAKDRDASKDNAGDSANFSAYNLNKDCLKRLGWQEGSCDLNDQRNLAEATRFVLRGMSQMGDDGFLCFHRGGSVGYQDRVSYGCVEYMRAMRETQQAILADRALMLDGRRIGQYIPHV